MNNVRIVSFLPAATEVVCPPGLADRLAGISHECDYLPAGRAKPVVARPALPVEQMSLREIDRAGSLMRSIWLRVRRELAHDGVSFRSREDSTQTGVLPQRGAGLIRRQEARAKFRPR